jgi:hypothetical protein
MGLFPIVSVSWSVSHLLVQEPCLLRGRRTRLLPILLPSPPVFSPLSAFISCAGYLLQAILALSILPLSLSSPLFAILHTAPPCLSPLIFIGVVNPRLPFPSTIWTLNPLALMTSAHVFLGGGCWCLSVGGTSFPVYDSLLSGVCHCFPLLISCLPPRSSSSSV